MPLDDPRRLQLLEPLGERGGGDAGKRLAELVEAGGAAGATVAAAFLITFVAALVFVAIAEGLSDEVLLRIVFNALASMVTAPIAALVASVLYFRLREIKDEPEERRAPGEAVTAPEPPTVG